jgi:ribonuclease HII
MDLFEPSASAEIVEIVCGIDEAGRGPLAGPVVAAAVILDRKRRINGLNDSKQLTEERRDILAIRIKERAIAWGIGWASVEEIDTVNIRQANFLAMRRAFEALSVKPTHALVDGNDPPPLMCKITCIIGGDAEEACISAASILAKTARDAHMVELCAQYPGYGFSKHKGYGSAAHMEALKVLGPSPVHRRSFAPVREAWEAHAAPSPVTAI